MANSSKNVQSAADFAEFLTCEVTEPSLQEVVSLSNKHPAQFATNTARLAHLIKVRRWHYTTLH